MLKKICATTAVVATVLAGGSACSSNVKNEERGASQITSSYSGVPDSFKKHMQRLAIVQDASGVSIDAQLFALKGANSLNKGIEKFALKALKDGGAFNGKKAFQPIATPESEQADLDSFISEPGASTATPTATSDAASADITLNDEIVFAGGKYVVTRATAEVNGEPSVKLFVTDVEADETFPASKLFAGEEPPSDDDLADLSYGSNALPSYQGAEKSIDELSDLGKDVTKSGSEDPVDPTANNAHATGFSCALAPCVAITYDDGPGGGDLTDKLIKTFKKHDAHATFFVIGKNVKEYPKEVKAMVDAGHEVGNHSYTHAQLNTLTEPGVEKEIKDTDKAIENAGVDKPTLLRPPYGASNRAVDDAAKTTGKHVIMWDVDTLDWKTRSTPKTVSAVKANARPGAIILMHSIHKPTVDAADTILTYLKKEGYSMVTISDLYKGSTFKTGKEYFCKGYATALCSSPEHPYVTKDS